MGNRTLALCLLAIAAGMSAAAGPARADTVAEVDSLSRATASQSSGMALARSQVDSGDLLGALASLERMLINNPDALDAQLLHASLLCRLDDRSGAVIEFDRLRGRGIAEAMWNEAIAPCNTNRVTRPTRRPGHE